MRGISYLYEGLFKPLVLVLILLLGFGLLTADSASGRAGVNGFACQGFTNNAEWNRTICRYHPMRLWNMPLSEIIPGLK